MAVAKLSDSKKAVIFIDHEGNQFFTSVVFLRGLLEGRSKAGFVELKMFPTKAPIDKWRKSPVWVDGVSVPYEQYFGKEQTEDVVRVDLMKPAVRAAKREKESYEVDDHVW